MVLEKTINRGIINLEKLKANPENPRVITNKQLDKLKKSIVDFPDMLSISPLVVDESFTIIGGNMRFKALKDLGYIETPFVQIIGMSNQEKKEFVIKDNINYGDWDWNLLLNEFPQPKLLDFGVVIPEHLIDQNDVRQEDVNTIKDQFNTWLNSDERTVKLFLPDGEYHEVIDQLNELVISTGVETYADVLVVLLQKYFTDNNLISDRR